MLTKTKFFLKLTGEQVFPQKLTGSMEPLEPVLTGALTFSPAVTITYSMRAKTKDLQLIRSHSGQLKAIFSI